MDNDKIARVMSNFDFAVVSALYQHMKWTWYMDTKKGICVPTEVEIRDCAWDLLKDAHAGGPGTVVRTGGLRASYDKLGMGSILQLEFIASQASS